MIRTAAHYGKCDIYLYPEFFISCGRLPVKETAWPGFCFHRFLCLSGQNIWIDLLHFIYRRHTNDWGVKRDKNSELWHPRSMKQEQTAVVYFRHCKRICIMQRPSSVRNCVDDSFRQGLEIYYCINNTIVSNNVLAERHLVMTCLLSELPQIPTAWLSKKWSYCLSDKTKK